MWPPGSRCDLIQACLLSPFAELGVSCAISKIRTLILVQFVRITWTMYGAALVLAALSPEDTRPCSCIFHFLVNRGSSCQKSYSINMKNSRVVMYTLEPIVCSLQENLELHQEGFYSEQTIEPWTCSKGKKLWPRRYRVSSHSEISHYSAAPSHGAVISFSVQLASNTDHCLFYFYRCKQNLWR